MPKRTSVLIHRIEAYSDLEAEGKINELLDKGHTLVSVQLLSVDEPRPNYVKNWVVTTTIKDE